MYVQLYRHCFYVLVLPNKLLMDIRYNENFMFGDNKPNIKRTVGISVYKHICTDE